MRTFYNVEISRYTVHHQTAKEVSFMGNSAFLNYGKVLHVIHSTGVIEVYTIRKYGHPRVPIFT